MSVRNVRYRQPVIRSDGKMYETVIDAVFELIEDGIALSTKSAAKGIIVCADGGKIRNQAYGYGWTWGQ